MLTEARDVEANMDENRPLRILDVLHGINEAAGSNRNVALFLENPPDDDGMPSLLSNNNVRNAVMKRHDDNSQQQQPLPTAWRSWLRQLKTRSAETGAKEDNGDDDDSGIQVIKPMLT